MGLLLLSYLTLRCCPTAAPPCRRSTALNTPTATAKQAAPAPALEAPSEAQLAHELALAYTDLGAATFALAYHSAAHDPRLASRIQRISELNAQLAELHWSSAA
ncbi:MAG: hypothetical protein ABSG43_30880 [Solirubrobacteraceae bacterium]